MAKKQKQNQKYSLRLTSAEFAKCWGAPLSHVHVYKSREKIIQDKDGYIDLDNPTNKKFIEDLASKGRFDITKKDATRMVRKVDESEDVPGDDSSKSQLDTEKKKTDIKLQKARIRAEQLKAEKLEGKLIPIQDAETLFIYAIEGFHSHYEQEVESILNTMASSVEISHERFVELRGQLRGMLTDLYNETRKDLIDGVKNLSEQYSEVRGKGEREL